LDFCNLPFYGFRKGAADMKRLWVLQNWHISWLFIGLGLSSVLFAWTTFNLFNVASSNFRFIAEYGIMGLADGGFQQFIEISWNALVSLLLFLLFKGCETEIIHRWRSRHGPDSSVDI
jgi:hypothetical protein